MAGLTMECAGTKVTWVDSNTNGMPEQSEVEFSGKPVSDKFLDCNFRLGQFAVAKKKPTQTEKIFSSEFTKEMKSYVESSSQARGAARIEGFVNKVPRAYFRGEYFQGEDDRRIMYRDVFAVNVCIDKGGKRSCGSGILYRTEQFKTNGLWAVSGALQDLGLATYLKNTSQITFDATSLSFFRQAKDDAQASTLLYQNKIIREADSVTVSTLFERTTSDIPAQGGCTTEKETCAKEIYYQRRLKIVAMKGSQVWEGEAVRPRPPAENRFILSTVAHALANLQEIK